ncbi:MAG: FAD-binding protein [Clostridiales bacterium]|nr:FAD-binding protein [Clostridiales bacterium]
MDKQYDVIIAGGGVAGLYAALHLDGQCRVLLACKRELTLCNSSLAQGGVAAVLDTVGDSFENHFEDTMIAGGRANRPEAVRVLVEEGPDDVRKTVALGAEFDRGPDGELHQTLEGGHGRRRIVHHKDSTGAEIMRALMAAVRQRPNIEISENTQMCFLDEMAGGLCATFLREEVYFRAAAPYMILATGGIGRVYQYTTNSAIATGDGIAMAHDLGAKIKNLHYVQFHPTAFAAVPGRERFLISEAVRGEGAWLLNGDGQRFMHRYDERLELAPRDVVSRSIMLESRRMGNENFYLDISRKDPAFIKDRFPMIYAKCLEEGVDITRDRIPVFPCQHYLMGGIDVDLWGRTRIDRLYAIGECSHTGVHGKNRLASNSLLEALVFGRRAAEDINGRTGRETLGGWPLPHVLEGAPLPAGTRTAVRAILQRAYFVIPDYDAAERGIAQVESYRKRLYRSNFAVTPDFVEAKSLCRIAGIILEEVVHR